MQHRVQVRWGEFVRKTPTGRGAPGLARPSPSVTDAYAYAVAAPVAGVAAAAAMRA